MAKKRKVIESKRPQVISGLSVAIVGLGSLGRVLALALNAGGFDVIELVVRRRPESKRRARAVAARLGAKVVHLGDPLAAKLVLMAVPDGVIGATARELSRSGEWQGKTVLHTSGALDASALAELKHRGASVGSAHPMNSFVESSSAKDLRGISFAVEGDTAAVRVAEKIARALRGKPIQIPAVLKPVYHAFGALASPLLVSLLAAAEDLGRAAGVKDPREAMEPIVRRTVENFFREGAAASFSGPMKRGDIVTLERHLRALRSKPRIRKVYLALAEHAAARLPVLNKAALKRLLSAE